MRKNFLNRKVLALASSAALLGSLAISMPMAAHASPTNGLIYWPSGSPISRSTSAVNPDGSAATVPSALQRITVTPVFNSAATKMAYTTSSGMNKEIKVADSDGTGTITVASGTGLQTPEFSDDGTKLYLYSSDGNGTSVVYSIDSATANQTLTGKDILTYAGNIVEMAVSKTGKIAFTATNGCGANGYGVLIRDLTGSGSGTLIPDSCSSVSGVSSTSPGAIAWNSDGTKLFVKQVTFDLMSSTRSNLVIDEFTAAGRVSGTPFYSHPGTDKDIYAVALSPDGTQLAFTVVNRSGGSETIDGIYTMVLATKVATKITTPADVFIGLSWGPVAASATPVAPTVAPTTTPTTAVPTTVASTTTVVNVYAAAKPGITVTDSKVYTVAPVEVSADSAINVLTSAQNKVMDIETRTPAVCLPNDDELVFIDEGKCVVRIVNAKTRAVLRVLKTTVVADDISEVKVGNAIVMLAPIYFDAMSSTLNAKAIARMKAIKSKISAAGSVLIIGHAGTLNGNSPANVAIAKARANSTLRALKSVGAKGPFAVSGVGALDPASIAKTEAAQAKNRRVVIALIP